MFMRGINPLVDGDDASLTSLTLSGTLSVTGDASFGNIAATAALESFLCEMLFRACKHEATTFDEAVKVHSVINGLKENPTIKQREMSRKLEEAEKRVEELEASES